MAQRRATDDRPLSISIVGGGVLDDDARDEIELHLRRRLVKLAPRIQRAVVRFEDENGPRGGIDTRCRIALSVRGRPPLLAEARAREALLALRRAAAKLVRVLRADLERHDYSTKPPAGGRARTRRAGGEAPAPRSGPEKPRPRPSRKPTPRPSERTKSATGLTRRVTLEKRSPEERARRSRARQRTR